MLRNPRAIPDKIRNYVNYDLVQLLNETMDAIGISESVLERIVARIMALPAQRFLRMKRTVSLLVTDQDGKGESSIVQGPYQSPILIQWKKAAGQRRTLNIHLVRFS